MSKIIYAAALTAAVLGLGATSAMAQGWGGPLGMLGRFDTDNDGKVSAAEYDAGRGGQFATMDADGDLKVTKDEYTAYLKQMAAQWGGGGMDADRMQHRIDDFMSADTDGDGAISAGEYAAQGVDRFKSMDTDGDGFISGDEAQAARGH